MGGLFPVSMSISTRSVLPMSPLPLEIMLSNRLHRSLNLPLVSSLIGVSFRSTFLCVSTSAGDLMKFVAVVKTLWRSVSVLMGANWANDHLVRLGTQFLGVIFLCKGYDLFLWKIQIFCAAEVDDHIGCYRVLSFLS